MQTVLTVFHIIIGILIVIMILLQSGADELKGLSGASSNNDIMSEAASSNFMTKFTSVLAAIFIINCLVLANISSKSSRETIADKISNAQKTISSSIEKPEQDKVLPIAK